MSRKFDYEYSLQEKLNELEVEHSISKFCPDYFQEEFKSDPLIGKKVHLMQMVKDFYQIQKLKDITVRIGNQNFHCHLLIIQCYSDYFANRSKIEKVIELPIDKVTPEAFHKIYSWMLSSQKTVRRNGLIEILMASEFLLIEHLVQQCWLLIEDCRRFREDEAFLLYLEAKACNHFVTQKLMLPRICKFFLSVVVSRDFLDMDLKEVVDLLELNSIGVNTELDVFYSAARWLLHNTDRQKYILEIFNCVRFGLIAPWKLVEFRINQKSGPLKIFLEHPKVREMIDSGLSYSTYKCSIDNDENSEQFLDFLERFELKRQYPRQMVLDGYWQSRYFKCDSNQHYNYEEFLHYIQLIRSNAKTYWKRLQIQ